jgi:mono/diheme cytochrome c family protein
MYTGDKKKFSDKDLEGMRARENRTNIKNPDPVLDNVERTMNIDKGEQLYNTYCRSCHQGNGMGDGNRYPPLVNSEWVNGDKKRLISVLLKGLEGPIKVLGKEYNNVMPKFNFLNNQQLADLMTYVRKSYSNNKSPVNKEEVANARKLLER